MFPDLVQVVPGAAGLTAAAVAFYVVSLAARRASTDKRRKVISAVAALIGVGSWVILRFG